MRRNYISAHRIFYDGQRRSQKLEFSGMVHFAYENALEQLLLQSMGRNIYKLHTLDAPGISGLSAFWESMYFSVHKKISIK